MSSEFLHVAEKHAGYPITLEEAVEIIMRARLGEGYLLDLPLEDSMAIRRWVWERLLVGFAANKAHAYVEAVESGHWYRVPSDYWNDWYHFVSGGRSSPPEHLRAIDNIESAPEHLIGSPIVVWQDQAMTWPAWWQIEEQANTGASIKLTPAPLPLEAKLGRPNKYNWNAAEAALSELDEMEDTFARIINGDLKQSVVERWLADWFAERGDVPATSALRSRVAARVQSRREMNEAKARK